MKRREKNTSMNKRILIPIKNGFVNFNTKHGAEIYRRSLSILFECAIWELYPDLRVQVGQTLMKGYYYEPVKGELPGDFVKNVTQRMNEIIKKNEKFRIVVYPKKKALLLCKRRNRMDKYRAIFHLPIKKIEFVFLRNYFDFLLAEPVKSTSVLKTFRIIKYNNGVILQFPARGEIDRLPEVKDRQRKLYKVYLEAKKWGEILGVQNAGDLNEAIFNGEIRNLILVQEAFHEKKIAEIADKIINVFPRKKLILIAGPSASGKTTFIKRLGVQLRAGNIIPLEISLDNYFVPREKTPKTPDGEYDYDSLKAVDLKFFRKQIKNLLEGKEIKVPDFNFRKGVREFKGERMKMSANSVLLVEGIHALNPQLLPEIPERNKYKIFVSALTQLRIDNDNRIFTSDSRLLRRIIRDYKYRGYSAEETIMRFPKVRQAEDNYIFPYQNRCDVFFNSYLFYEQAVIKKMVECFLRKIKKSSPAYFEARRLLYYLRFFLPISLKRVPQNSILREFTGKSSFHY